MKSLCKMIASLLDTFTLVTQQHL